MALFWGVFKVGLLGWVFCLLLIAIIIKSILKKPVYQKELVTGLLSSGYVFLLTNHITGEKIFAVLSQKVAKFLSLSDYGAEFLFGNLALKEYFGPTDTWPGFGFQFGFTVLPVIIFFAATMSILYHLGVMQLIIKWMARFMQWTMGTSGAETLSCTANIFVGQTEAPLLIRPFLDSMTLSELLTIMVGGFATIAGGVLAGYIAMGISAGHLIAASVMSAPAALAVAKIIFPEVEYSKTSGDVEFPKDLIKSTNLLDAASRGVTDGLKLAVNVGAMLIAFIALIALVDTILSVLDRFIDGKLFNGFYGEYATASGFSPIKGEYSGFFPGSLKTLFGTMFRPLAWLMGVSWKYAGEVGNLLGIKIALNEFVAYGTLAELIKVGALSEKAAVISTYALCGFANFASIGIQIGGIGALAPGRRSDLSKVALKAMFGGAIASWITASIAGILL
ncbi:MAG: NupC/NupG family nucleoside CNT transporter [Candidatus Neomarinimicrobiota bacterium]|nr:MAG: NupC/NupG family nucleoside CNT transporter [Candidatus Neomarinimicrobiota bacterium]